MMTAIQSIQDFLPDENTAALVTSEVNRRYLSGFHSSAGAILVTKNRSVLMLDFRYYEAATRCVEPPLEVVRFVRLIDDLNRVFLDWNIRSVYIEGESVTVARCHELEEAFIPAVLTDGLSAELNRIRMCKTEQEVEKIITAQRITERAYTEVLNILKPGVTERHIAIELEHLIKLYGGERVAFDLICVTGENTSLPHGVPGDRIVKDGDFFTFDIGAVYEGYHSDTTRTVAVGSATDEMREIYGIVLNAQITALAAIKAGVNACDVDKTARDIIAEAGYGKYFGHSTGHGVGLDIHELPFVSAKSETVLTPGMIITDEPGIYLPDKFGVRIEDMVCVTENGCRNFVSLPKELLIL